MKRLSSVSSTSKMVAICSWICILATKLSAIWTLHRLQVVDSTVSLEYVRLFCYHAALKYNTYNGWATVSFVHSVRREVPSPGGPHKKELSEIRIDEGVNVEDRRYGIASRPRASVNPNRP